MWSTTMARNFPSPSLCGGDMVCSSSAYRPDLTFRRRKHPSSSSSSSSSSILDSSGQQQQPPSPPQLLGSPLTPQNCRGGGGGGGAKNARQRGLLAKQPQKSLGKNLPSLLLPVVVDDSMTFGKATPTTTTTLPTLEIDTSKLNSNRPHAVSVNNNHDGGPTLDASRDDKPGTTRNGTSSNRGYHHHEKEPLTPWSSLRRCQRNIPSPPPTPETISCGSSCSYMSSSSSSSSSSCDNNKTLCPTEEADTKVTTHRHDPKQQQQQQRPVVKSVRFSRVEIREHPRILGDNPSVKKGPALSIGWYSNGKEISYDVDTYEAMRAPQRRSNHALALSSSERRQLLLREAGVSTKDIYKARMEISKIKHSRRQHNLFLKYDETIIVVESCLQTVQGLLMGRLSDRELAKLMEQAKLADAFKHGCIITNHHNSTVSHPYGPNRINNNNNNNNNNITAEI